MGASAIKYSRLSSHSGKLQTSEEILQTVHYRTYKSRILLKNLKFLESEVKYFSIAEIKEVAWFYKFYYLDSKKCEALSNDFKEVISKSCHWRKLEIVTAQMFVLNFSVKTIPICEIQSTKMWNDQWFWTLSLQLSGALAMKNSRLPCHPGKVHTGEEILQSVHWIK